MNKESLCRWCGQNKTDCESSMEDAKDMIGAAGNDDLNRLKFLIQGGISPNIHNYGGYIALHEAIRMERISIVEYLLTLPDINLEQRESSYKRTPLHSSIRINHYEITKMLIEKGANLKALDRDGDSILHMAISRKALKIVNFILTKGVDINLTNKSGETPLHLAVSCRNVELVSMLLYYNADTNIMDDEGYTPFMNALNEHCDENIQRELFKYECNFNRETADGNTLVTAVHDKSSLIIDLIENGADVNYYCDSMVRSILGLILEKSNPEIFYYVFLLTNLSILTEFKESIFISLLKCDYSKEDWLKALFLILESDVLSELIDHYYTLTDHLGLFAKFAKKFRWKKIAEDEFVKLVEICLCSGANVMFKDIEAVYEVYSNNKALPHLLNMKIENLPDFSCRLPLLFCSLPYIFCSFDKNFASVLNVYYKYNNCARLRSNSVPSLLELSRNEAIITICTRYDINSSHWYYYILRFLNLYEIFYDFLTFRRLIE